MPSINVPDEIENTSFGYAYEAGAKAGTEKGPFIRWWPDLQMTNVLKMTGYEEHSDVPGVRLRRHSLITSETGWFKSSSTRFFLEHGIGCVPVDEVIHDDGVPMSPTMFKASGLSSYEALVGSASNDGQLLRPKFAATDYVYSSELMTFLGGDSSRQQETVDRLCQLLEEGHITRRLVKFRNVELSDSDELWLENNGVEFDQEDGTMKYDAHCSLIGCTRPLDAEVEETLERSGLRSRFFHSPWPAEDEGVRAIEKMGGPQYRPEDMIKLRDFNAKLFHTEFEEMPHPPQDAFHEVYEVYRGYVEELVQEAGEKAAHVIDGRDFMTVKQFLTGAAVERTVRKLPEEAFGTGNIIQEIQYLDHDVEVAKYFAKLYGQTKFDLLTGDFQVDELERQDLHNLRTLIGSWNDHDKPMPTEWMRDTAAQELITMQGTTMSNKKTFYNFLNRCLNRGWMTRIEKGRYMITERGHNMAGELNQQAVADVSNINDDPGTVAL